MKSLIPNCLRRFVPQCVSMRKACLGLCMLFVLLFMVISNVFDDNARFSCKKSQEVTGTGSISKHQAKFDQTLYTYLQNHEEKAATNTTSSDWLQILPHIYGYSAYISESAVPDYIKTRYYIKILTVILPSLEELHSTPTKLSCVLSFSDGRLITTAGAYLFILPEHHSKCYRAAYFYCPVATHAMPSNVSLIYNNSSPKWIKVHSALVPKGRSLPNEISVCVRPLFGPYKSIIQIAEFIGYYQSLGVTRILFYNYTVTPEVSKFLFAISKSNTVIKIEIHAWSLSKVNLESNLLHAEGQMVFNQDCILRLTSDSRYVGIVDLDEFIMPQNTLNLGKVLRELETENPRADSFLFSSVMFCEELLPRVWDNGSWPLLTQIVTKRQKTPWLHTYRSKYIVMPQRINVAMIHEIQEHVEPFYTVNVSPSTILLYHCRECCGLTQPYFFGLLEFEPMEGDTFIEDVRMRKISKQLNESVSISLVNKIYSNAKIN